MGQIETNLTCVDLNSNHVGLIVEQTRRRGASAPGCLIQHRGREVCSYKDFGTLNAVIPLVACLMICKGLIKKCVF